MALSVALEPQALVVVLDGGDKLLLPLNLPQIMMQTKWKSVLDPLLLNPLNQVSILSNIVLSSGANIINHKLGRTPQGWFLTDIQEAAHIYRSQPFNEKTLTLFSDGTVTVNVGVF